MRWACLALIGCGRIGFGTTTSGDGSTGDDGGATPRLDVCDRAPLFDLSPSLAAGEVVTTLRDLDPGLRSTQVTVAAAAIGALSVADRPHLLWVQDSELWDGQPCVP